MKKVNKRKLNILVTAGPTREPLDPVRYISNYATGFLGYAICREAKARGHRVILISGPTILPKPQGVPCIDVVTARQMYKALQSQFNWCNCLMMTAAVGDFRAKKVTAKKIKRSRKRKLILELAQNPDILAEFGRRKGKRIVVGFALETEGLAKNAQEKLRQKNLDLIVATQIKTNNYPFGSERIAALMMGRNGLARRVKRTTKRQLSRILLDSIEKIMLS